MRLGLLVSDLTEKHGWGHYSLSMIRALRDAGIDLKIIAPTNNQLDDAALLGNILPRINPPDTFSLLRMAFLVPKIGRLFADCDILHSTIEAYAPLLAAVSQKRPYFITAHGSYVNLPRIRAWPIGLLYRQAFQNGRLICVSRYTQKVAQSIIPEQASYVVPNAVNFERFAHLERQENPIPTILSSGGVKYRKGTLELVRAVAKLRETIPNLQCKVLGTLEAEPHYVKSVREEISRLGVEKHVELLGFVDSDCLLDWYAKAHVFVLPSINIAWKFEGFGLVHLEASAAGLPVIGTRDCGAEDAIDDGMTGLLVSQAHIDDELAPAILDILSQPEKAASMGAAGRAKAKLQRWDKVAAQVIQIYQEALR